MAAPTGPRWPGGEETARAGEGKQGKEPGGPGSRGSAPRTRLPFPSLLPPPAPQPVARPALTKAAPPRPRLSLGFCKEETGEPWARPDPPARLRGPVPWHLTLSRALGRIPSPLCIFTRVCEIWFLCVGVI